MRRGIGVALMLAACGGGRAEEGVSDPGHPPEPTPPPDGGQGSSDSPRDPDLIPAFSSQFYLDLAQVERISRFRSGLGHDYADSYEQCRSMKHYVCPLNCPGTSSARVPAAPAWTELELRSPLDGIVVALDAEQTYGTQVVLEPEGYPEFRVKIFHVAPAAPLMVGAHVAAGQQLGTHASAQTMSDIAVEQYRSDGFRLLSFFDTLTDDGFAPLAARGVPARSALQISAGERDAEPLACNGEQFTSAGTLENWVVLR